MSTIITRRSLSRRAVLRGLGAGIALPFLDCMVPAFGAVRTAAVRRLGAIYVPNGMNMWEWTPKAKGRRFELTSIMQPLAPFREYVLVLSGMAHKEANALPGEGSGDHPRAQAAFLTGVHCKKTEGADLEAGISMDQIAAREFGEDTQFRSLELSLEANEIAGGCENGYSCAYTGTMSWANANTPLPMETNPRAVFERLFGATDSTDRHARLARVQQNRSILDYVKTELDRLKSTLGVSDLRRLTEYLESVRDIERRIRRAEEQGNRELPAVSRPQGIPATFEEHARLQFDLMALAWQADLTRVSTFLMGREQSIRAYPEIGVPDSHHPISHHQGRADSLAKLAKINELHVGMFAHFLERLHSTPDGDGSLLDHAMILYGSAMSNSDTHIHTDLPILLAGRGGGAVKAGRHVRFSQDEPLTNLHLTLLEKMGIRVERLGDSTGKVDVLSEV